MSDVLGRFRAVFCRFLFSDHFTVRILEALVASVLCFRIRIFPQKSNAFEVTIEGGKKEGSMSAVDFVIAKPEC
ncbi:hypothetical protein V6N11_013374 [Hibiscus sabdariffa]|uniref:Uncharacterized protein n=1 Tax=Hibiscus sabdariffa TaxID=183260 RepID=A0ABR2NN43_9ROSI